ncbi:hypothetical protein HQN90_11840 [Paenibacillus alba]|uniref:hypothetical protein n=1 Tax=Paenibacillus alba TaxID=1197127 RepID=UPI001563F89B|nr:hypothetical protein [Paenibacillus alba]NQX66815.1 hypothetical protein [Paenibacillus alba]
MPSSTTNMGLYKKNPSTDGNDTFDINTMLNDNWDRIDSQVGGQLGNSAPMAVNLVNGLQVVTAPKGAPLENLRITGRTLVNLLGRDGGCEDVSKWSAYQSTFSLDATNKTTGSSAIKVTISATFTSGSAVEMLRLNLSNGKNYLLAGDIKNGNATKGRLTLINGGGSAMDITDTTKFNTTYLAFTQATDTTAAYVDLGVIGAAGQYAYFDAVRVYEITAAEKAYINGLSTAAAQSYITAKYPYVDDVKHVNAPYVINYGENLLPPFVEWAANGAPTNLAISDPYSISFGGTSSAGTFTCIVPVVQGQTYTISMTKDTTNARLVVYKGNASSYTAAIATTTNTATFTVDGTYAGNSVMVQIDNGSVAGPYTFNNPRMSIGPVDKVFKSRNDDMLAFPNVQLASSVDGTVYDTLFKRDGKYFVEKRFKDVVLDGSLAWLLGGSGPGNKTVQILAGIVDSKSTFPDVVRYDGKILLKTTSVVDALWIDIKNGNLLTVISNTDSGWGDSYTNPSTAEIQAYFYGWKMYDGVNGANPYNTGTKAWCYRTLGGYTGGTNTLPTAPAPYTGAFTPYKLTYQLAVPTFEEITVETGMSLHEGRNQVEVGQGIVLREKMPLKSIDGIYYTLNDMRNTSTYLKSPISKIVNIFKNGKLDSQSNRGSLPVDSSWTLNYFDAVTRGLVKPVLHKSGFDPSATYEVSYIASDQYLLAAPVQAVDGEVASNLKTVVDALSTNQADQEARISANEILARQIYNVPQKTSAAMSLYVDAVNGADNNDGSAGKPFKSIQRAVNSIPQIVNHTVSVICAAGTYNEDVIIDGFTCAKNSGIVAIIGATTATTTHSVNSFFIHNCFGRVSVEGFNATNTSAAGIGVAYSNGWVIYACNVTTASINSGIAVTVSTGRIESCITSNRGTGLNVSYYSQVFIQQCIGTNNTIYGINSSEGSFVSIDANTTVTGILAARGAFNGGIISTGVLNPWGDNTQANRSRILGNNNATQSISAATATKVLFQIAGIDNLGEWVSSKFTAKSAGTYDLSGSLVFSSGFTASMNYGVWIYRNGVAYRGPNCNGGTSYAAPSIPFAFKMDLAANDYVEIYITTSVATIVNTGSWVDISRTA